MCIYMYEYPPNFRLELVVDIRCNELNVHKVCEDGNRKRKCVSSKPCFFFAAVCFHRGRS